MQNLHIFCLIVCFIYKKVLYGSYFVYYLREYSVIESHDSHVMQTVLYLRMKFTNSGDNSRISSVRGFMKKAKNTLLVVDNEPQTYKILDIVLDRLQYEIIECSFGKQAINLCVSLKPDIILLDPDLPDIGGSEIIRVIREWSRVPIIIITNRKADQSMIDALDGGADDYVIKPFNANVLRARIDASLRKAAIHETGAPELTNGLLRMDLVRHEVFLADKLISLTPKEYSLLRYFIIHRGKMLGHRQILNEVWGSAHSDDIQYLRVFVGQIRQKIENDPTDPVIITTEPGIGYRMEIMEEDSSYKTQKIFV